MPRVRSPHQVKRRHTSPTSFLDSFVDDTLQPPRFIARNDRLGMAFELGGTREMGDREGGAGGLGGAVEGARGTEQHQQQQRMQHEGCHAQQLGQPADRRVAVCFSGSVAGACASGVCRRQQDGGECEGSNKYIQNQNAVIYLGQIDTLAVRGSDFSCAKLLPSEGESCCS